MSTSVPLASGNTHLEAVRPGSKGHDIIVRVLEKKFSQEQQAPDGTKHRVEDFIIADETACMVLTAKNEQCDKLEVGKTVALRNCKALMGKKHMRLVLDKWGSVGATTRVLPSEMVNTDKNMSQIVYEQLNP